MKVAVVFDNRLRPETTGFYCRRALSRLADVEHLWPEELDLVPAGLFDLFFMVDDGLDYAIPQAKGPTAAWAIDTHIDFDRTVRRFGNVDFLFAAQRNGATVLSKATRREVVWLPLACDPAIHRPVPGVLQTVDLAFVGHLIGHRRIELISMLERQIPNSRFCQARFDEMAQTYSSSRVGFNCSIADDINMRLFEIPAHRIPLVTNSIEFNGLEELFDIGRHLLVYKNDDELFAAVEKLLSDAKFRESIAIAGYQHVLKYHTYDHRMQELLRCIQLPRKAIPSRHVASSTLPTKAPSKSFNYFEFSRPDVQSLVPLTAKRILDVGCGGGRLGEELKLANGAHVTGVEASPIAAERARTRLDCVIEKSIEETDSTEFPREAFDAIVFADVLEHLRDPASVLKQCLGWLTSTGSIIVSVPNSRHHSVISGLIAGNWTYERAGLLDDDHVRCFTRRELEKLLFRCGFELELVSSVPGSGYQQWEEAGKPGTIRIDGLNIAGLPTQEAEEFFTYQYVIRAVRREQRNFGLTSIVIVTWNQLPFTIECVDSILSRTDESIELVFVDNGSTDGTADYLATIPDAHLIRNKENRGFAAAVNQGLQTCTGKQIVLLNNDCVVSTGWLNSLLTVLYDDDQNGLVGPVSNNVSGEQQIPVTYSDLSSMDGFAWEQRRNRTLAITDRLVGFCLLFRRELMDKIGLLDERFKIGCYEDDDFCRRALASGYRAVIANNTFVHHYGSATFLGAGLNFSDIMQENQQRYIEKWEGADNSPRSPEQAIGGQNTVHPSYEFIEHSSGELLLKRRNVRLSLCMIVRDNEDTIEDCINSVYPWVDEIIVIDTGSVDRTPEICRSFGARVFEFPWCDDFSSARNESLKHASGDWIFWMDSDDVIPDEQGKKLRALVYGEHAEGLYGYVMQVHCPSFEEGDMTIVDHVKIFRNHTGISFEHRIHEQILPAIRRIGGTVAFTDMFVVHSGSRQSAETRIKKLDRDFRLLKLDLERYSDHPFVLFNLGMTHEDAGEYEQAETYLQRSIDVANDDESHLRKAWALLINCKRQMGRPMDAMESAMKALQLFPGDKELLFRRATLWQEIGELNQAVDDYKSILNANSEKVFQSVDPGIMGHKAYHNLALALQELGKLDEAIAYWRSAIALSPNFPTAWLALGRVLATSDQWESLNELMMEMPDKEGFESARAILTAKQLEAANDMSAVHRVLENAWNDSGDTTCLDELCRFLTEQGRHDAALSNLALLHATRPDDPSVMHNLGITMHLCGSSKEGISMLENCLQIAPDRVRTTCQLAAIHEELGNSSCAIATLTKAVERMPGIEAFQDALKRLQIG